MPDNVTIPTERYTNLLVAECVCGMMYEIMCEKIALEFDEVELLRKMLKKAVDNA